MRLMIADKAQSLAEYAVLVALILAALAGIGIYLQRGLQGRYKTVVDAAAIITHIKEDTTTERVGISQYEPYYAQSEQTTDNQQTTTHTYKPGGAVSRQINSTVAVTDATEASGMNIGADDAWN